MDKKLKVEKPSISPKKLGLNIFKNLPNYPILTQFWNRIMNDLQKRKKNRMISFRLTEDQHRYLDCLSVEIYSATGFKITRASIILKLMELGLPVLEKELSLLKNRSEIRDKKAG